jgi:signal transduction histidine kinase
LRTLRWRLTLWYGGMTALIVVLLTATLYLSVREVIVAVRQKDVKDTAAFSRQVLEETGSPDSAVGEIQKKDVRKVSQMGELRRKGVRVAIRDADGNVLAASPGTKNLPKAISSEVSYPDVQQRGYYLTTTFDSEKIPGASGQVWSMTPTIDPVLHRLSLTGAAGIAVALVLMLGFGPILAGRALRPLKSVSAVAGELRKGRLGSRVNLPKLKSRRDEVGEVATSFDTMAESLERLFKAERDSKEILRRFLADVSHEFSTPLTSILGYLDILQESGDMDPAIRHQALSAMREEGDRMARLVQDLLLLARLDTQREMSVELVDLVALAREVTGNHPKRGIEFVAPDAAVPVLADREALRRVISNLLSNAVRHTPPENRILVSVDREAEEAILRVADEGEGISEEAVYHVFERFYQADSSRASEGSGLGLAIVKETVEALEGRVEVESAPGEGSTFTVRLPLSQGTSEENPREK